MPDRPAADARALSVSPSATMRLGAMPLLGAALIWALGALTVEAQDDDLIVTHAIATFGLEDLTYPADFEHLAYVNPDAPQGGEMSLS